MKWISSTGGPLVCGEKDIIEHWKGNRGSSVGNSFPINDYDRACEVIEYVELIECNSGKIIVFGDEPMQTGIANLADGGIAVIRWVYANEFDENEFISKINRSNNIIKNDILFELKSKYIILMDSVECGEDIDNDNILRAELITGYYHIYTENIALEGEYNFIVHRFIREMRERSVQEW